MVYEFSPAQYLGNGVWRGIFHFSVSGCHVTTGDYELFMFSGTEGTINIRDNYIGTGSVGTVNLSTREMNYRNAIYHP